MRSIQPQLDSTSGTLQFHPPSKKIANKFPRSPPPPLSYSPIFLNICLLLSKKNSRRWLYWFTSKSLTSRMDRRRFTKYLGWIYRNASQVERYSQINLSKFGSKKKKIVIIKRWFSSLNANYKRDYFVHNVLGRQYDASYLTKRK